MTMPMNEKKCKIMIENRNYSQWQFLNDDDATPLYLDGISPVTHHLFHEDIFTYTNQFIVILESPLRNADLIPGVLLLENNKTYGYGSHSNNRKHLYKCVPDNPRYPVFLVPYEISVGFSKKFVNKYVTFRFKEWNADQQHPVGVLVETMGDVTHLPAFCEYRVCCRELRYPMSYFTKQVKTQIQEKRTCIESIIKNADYQINDRTNANRKEYIIAIDPEGSRDYDDAFSAVSLDDGGYYVSVHIANVFLWLESMELWNLMTDACATVYLPDKRRHMLPAMLSNDLCILNSRDEKRLAFTMNLRLNNAGDIQNYNFENTAIHVAKNYVYESAECLVDPAYRLLYKLAKMRDDAVLNSHDVVAHWMIEMNRLCGHEMAKRGVGVFRKTTQSNQHMQANQQTQSIPVDIHPNTRRVLQSFQQGSFAEYTTIQKKDNIVKHDLMNLTNYAHITSPIRRLVDILNQMWFIWELGLVKKEKCSQMSHEFLEKHVRRLETINAQMRAIKKTQQECELLYKITENPDIQTLKHRGIILDIQINNRKNEKDKKENQITAYLEALNIMITVGINPDVCGDIEVYSYREFQVYVFEDEYKIRQKLRWMLTE